MPSLLELASQAPALLQLQDAAAWERATATCGCAPTGAEEQPSALLAVPEWRAQLLGAVALVLAGGDDAGAAALWHAVDGASWVAPQLIAAAFFVDADFAQRAETRLLDGKRRPPKTIGALVRAYHRLPSPSLQVLAQLGGHARTLATEEARVGVRGVDAWLDRLPCVCDALTQSRWQRRPR
jgi:hypothetical protein